MQQAPARAHGSPSQDIKAKGSLFGACGSGRGSTPVCLGSIGRHDESDRVARRKVPQSTAWTASNQPPLPRSP